MDYFINPAKFSSAFVVPTEVVDNHIKLAGSAQLKVLLWLLRHGSNAKTEDIAEALNLVPADVCDCLQYWLQAGIVLRSGEPAETPEPAPPAEKKEPAKIKAVSLPTREEIARRGTESKEIAFLLSEAQLKFGRIVNYAESGTLVWLHDYEGLPVSVILMIIEYAISQGKGTIKYIEKTGIDWASKDINTLQKAENHLVELAEVNKAWRTIQNAFGIDYRRPSAKEEQYASRWIMEWGFSKAMLKAAYEICVDATSKLSLPYINKILEKWHKNGIKSVEDIRTEKAEERAPKPADNSSLDMDEIELMIRQNSMD